jgi:hypothetical protein
MLLPSSSAYGQSRDGTGSWWSSYFADWFNRVAKTQAEQPHWITPLATVSPHLGEEFRYDIDWQTNNAGVSSANYGGGKGLKLIPFEHVEVLINLPPYFVHNNPAVPDGFGDFSFNIKYRLLSANEIHGNYMLTALIGASLPTGSHTNGALDAIVVPAIAYGKGFGRFDTLGNFSIGFPTSDTNLIGRTYAWNNTLQYHIFKKFWPEVELNSTFFQQSKNDGKKQMFVTPGMIIGRLHLWGRMGLTFGGGVQIAATHFHTTNHNGIFTLRLPF